MLTVPAAVWQGGPLRRGFTVGIAVGLFFGVLTWLDSGMLLGGVLASAVTGIASGVWMSRRMARFWPAAEQLTGQQRHVVAATVRRGGRIADPALAPAVLACSRGMQAAAERGRPWRWVVVVVLLVVIIMALWDAVMGSVGNALASLIYLVLIGLEMSWWPNKRAELLTNAERASVAATQIQVGD
ncbi:MAG: hypothetical protein K0R68_3327 [Mycobacterium sp.]|nr:hypothetical protein [Mycobacterium sp.]